MTENKSGKSPERDSNPGPAGLRVRCSDHSATLPPIKTLLTRVLKNVSRQTQEIEKSSSSYINYHLHSMYYELCSSVSLHGKVKTTLHSTKN